MTEFSKTTANTLSLPHPPLKVLLVEDELYYGKLIQKILKVEGQMFTVTWVTNLSMALDILTEQDFDVILTDLELPDAHDLEAFYAIRSTAADVPIVILTHHSDNKFGLEAVQNGAHDFLVKERVSAESLVRSIRYAVERLKSENLRSRLEAIKDFMGMLVHDMRTPLIGADRVLEHVDNPALTAEEKNKLLATMRSSNTKLLNLVSKLIEVYQYEVITTPLDFRPLKLDTILAGCLQPFVPTLELKSIKVEHEIDPALNMVHADKASLDRLFTNLIENASRFSPENSVITIRAGNLSNGMVYVSLTNRGTMPDDVNENLFKRFWHGTPGKSYVVTGGMGLYLCYRIAGAHNAELDCKSSDDQTTITVKLWAIERQGRTAQDRTA